MHNNFRLALVLLLVLLFSGVGFAALTPVQPQNGDGTIDNPYEITSAAELYWLASTVNDGKCASTVGKGNCSAKLMRDITVNELVLTDGNGVSKVDADGNYIGDVPENIWTPIGTTKAYVGTFDGDGHTIGGLYFNNDNTDAVGLFGLLRGNVINVGVVDSYIHGRDSVGGVVGKFEYNPQIGGSVANVFNTGFVNGHWNVGGVVGFNEGTVNDVYNMGSVRGTNSVGGVVGFNKATVSDVYNMGSVSGTSRVGGIVGSNYSGSVSYCYFNNDSFNGNAVGFSSNSKEKNAYGVTSVDLALVGIENAFPESDAWHRYDGAQPVLDNGKLVYKLPGLKVFKDVYPEVESRVLGIGTAEQLMEFAQQVNAGDTKINAKLTAHIVLNKNVLKDGTLNGYGSSFTKWTPIGTAANPYEGTFDGGGFTISGLYINDNEKDTVGLFGKIANTGVVKKLGMLDSYIKGRNDVGGVVGYNDGGSVSDVYGTCFVSGNQKVGGLVGYNKGAVSSVYEVGSVSGVESGVGGIVGYNDGGSVSNGYFDMNMPCENCSNLAGVQGLLISELAKTLPTGFSKDVWETGSIETDNDGNVIFKLHYLKGANTVPPVVMLDVDTDKYLKISNERDLNLFAGLVNSGATEINAKLAAHIVLNANVLKDGALNGEGSGFTSWTPIGTQAYPYVGTFDGKGFTVSGLYFNDDDVSAVGFFGRLGKEGTVKNVGIADSYLKGDTYVGAVVGANSGSVSNVYNAGAVVIGLSHVGGVVGSGSVSVAYNAGAVSGKNNVGGVVGSCSGSVRDVYNIGPVNGSASGVSGVYVGGVVGWLSGCSVINAYNAGSVDGRLSIGGLVGKNDGGSVSNSYYNTEIFNGNAVGTTLNSGSLTNVSGKTALELATFDVSEAFSGSDAWVRYEGSQPILDNEKLICRLPGLKAFKDVYPEYVLLQLKNGVYEIGTANQLKGFVQFVNNGNSKANAKLTADIVLNKDVFKDGKLNVADTSKFTKWTPINSFEGTFNGDGHTISGLYFNTPNALAVGFFNTIEETGVVENLGVINSYIHAFRYVGGIAGGIHGGKIRNVFFTGSVIADNDYAGGIASFNSRGTIENAYNMGFVSGWKYPGGIVGSNDGGAVKNVYNAGSVVCGDNFAGGIAGLNGNGGSIKYAYYNTDAFQGNVIGDGNGTMVGARGASAAELATLDVSEAFPGSEAWTRYEGSQPVLENGKLVYKLPGLKAFGVYPEVIFMQPKDGVYEIGTADQLICFARFVNNGNTKANAKLTANIVLNKDVLKDGKLNIADTSKFTKWTPIKSFEGTFDGDGLTISGLYFNNDKKDSVGLFGKIGGTGVVENVGVVYSYIKGKDYVGSVAAVNLGSVSDVYSAGSVSGNKNVGGLIGYNKGAVSNVYNTGSVGGSDAVGGVAGVDDGGSVNNSYYNTEIFKGNAVGTTLNSGSLTNVSGKTALELASLDVSEAFSGSEAWTRYEGEQPVLKNGKLIYKLPGLKVSGVYEMILLQSKDGVYEIGTADQLKGFARIVNSGNIKINAKLTADIVLNTDVFKDGKLNVADTSKFTKWTVIKSFEGNFNGDGHTISGVYFNDDKKDSVGLFGKIGDAGVVENVGVVDSYIKGKNYVGGVTAVNLGSVSNVYNTGAVGGNQNVGGLVGYNKGSVSNVYNSASVSGTDAIGGVAGVNDKGSINNGYYNIELFNGNAVGKTQNSGSTKNVSGKTTMELATLDVDKAFSGSDAWVRYEGEQPVLENGKLIYKLPGLKVSGVYEMILLQSKDGMYEIGTADQLKGFARIVNSGNIKINAKLTANIELNTDVFKEGTLNVADTSKFTKWTPIANYEGTFNGDGHTISGVYFNDDKKDSVGLFGKIGNVGFVENVGIVDSYIKGKDYVGSVTAVNLGSVSNVYNTGAVGGDQNVGGLVGYNKGSVSNVYNSASVSGTDAIGGVAGVNDKGSINNGYYNIELFNGNAVGKTQNSGSLTNVSGKTALELASLDVSEAFSGSEAWTRNEGEQPVLKNGKLIYKLPGLKVSGVYEMILLQSKDGVYEIGTADQLKGFARIVNSGNTKINARLTANIVLNENVLRDGALNVADTSKFTKWTPIKSFEGTFDGDGHTISGLYFNNDKKDSVGLFGKIGGTGVVENVGVVYSYIKGKDYVGSVAAVNLGSVSDVYSAGSVSGNKNVGGLIGYNKGAVSNVYNAGSVGGSNAVGGVAGVDDGGSVNNSYYNTEIFKGNAVGTTLNSGSLTNVSGKTVLELASLDVSAAFPGSDAWIRYEGSQPVLEKEKLICRLPGLKASGVYPEVIFMQPKDGVYEIGTADQLKGFARIVNSGNTKINARLTANIVLNENVLRDGALNVADTSKFTKWIPIESFEGTFDGAGHTVSGLYINNPSASFGGFISKLKKNGVVKNVGVIDSYVNGSSYVGGLVGHNEDGKVSCVYYTGSVVANSEYVGGIVGYNNRGAIGDVYNTGSVSGQRYVGGIVGSNDGGAVTNVYNVGIVKGSEETVGGIAGFNGRDGASIKYGYYSTDSFKGNVCGEGNGTIESSMGKTMSDLVSLDANEDFPGSSAWSNYEGEQPILKDDWSVIYKLPGLTAFKNVYPEVVDPSVYEIGSAEQLKEFARRVNNGEIKINARLTADIVLNKNVLDGDFLNGDGSNFSQWTPIGTEKNPYQGIFNGNGHTISGIYINNDKMSYVGLFGIIENSGVAANVGVVDSYIAGDMYVGGIVGFNKGSVTRAFNMAMVMGGAYFGGIAGESEGFISDVYNMNSVSGIGDHVGGIVGENAGSVRNVYSAGSVKGGNWDVGSVIGNNAGEGTVHNAYYVSDMACYNCKDNGLARGLSREQLASLDISSAFPKSDAWMVYSGKQPVLSDDGETVYKLPGLKVLNTYPEINVESYGGVIEIKTAAQLKGLAQRVNNGDTKIDVVLGADICLNACEEGEKPLLEQIANGKRDFVQWTPIGVPGKPYVGNFDGKGHTIRGLFIDNENMNQVGLFGVIGVSGTAAGVSASVKNVGLIDSYVKGADVVGGVVGLNDKASISDVYNAGTVYGAWRVGGVVGHNNSGSATNVYNLGEVKGDLCVGGVVGESNGSVSRVYNDALVSGAQYVGGVVGYNAGKVSDAYNMGSVSSEGYRVGGVVGNNMAFVDNVYSSADVKALGYDGGAVGYSQGGSINNVYYNTDMICEHCGGSVGFVEGEAFVTNASGMTTAQLAALDVAEAFKGSEAWVNAPKDNPTKNNGKLIYKLPGLKAFSGLYPDVEFTVYQISNVDELKQFASRVNNGENKIHGELTRNIELNSGVLKDGSLNVADTSKFTKWTPIGTNANPYAGVFDGKGFTISGLYFNDATKDTVGLFGKIANSGTVKNVGLIDSYINGKNDIGGIVGYEDGCFFSNVYNTGVVVGIDAVGGVAGVSRGTLSEVYNMGRVKGNAYVGGVVGYKEYGSVAKNYNMGAVSGYYEVGGLVGRNANASVSNSYNKGKVSVVKADGYVVGGIVGHNLLGALVNDVYNMGEVCANLDVGGIVGAFEDGSMSNAYSSADVSGNGFVGGTVGYSKNGSISNVYYNTDMICKNCGGIIGTAGENTSVTNAFGKTTAQLAALDVAEAFNGSDAWLTSGDDIPAMTNEKCIFKLPGLKAFEGLYPVVEFPVYQISNADELKQFATRVNNGETKIYGKLTGNVELNSGVLKNGKLNVADTSKFTKWTPIGTNSNPYAGVFDGKGFTISGLYFNDATKDTVGFFGKIASSGIVKNVGLVNSYIEGKNNIGGIVGYDDGGSISKVFCEGAVNGNENVGGVVGMLLTGSLNDVYSMGLVTGSMQVGGVVGYKVGGAVSNVYTSADVGGDGFVGGVIGVNRNGSISYSYYNTDMLCEHCGGVVGYVDGDASVTNASGVTTVQLATLDVAEAFNKSDAWEIYNGNQPVISNGKIVYKLPRLKASDGAFPEKEEYDYYEISDAKQLFEFAERVNGGNSKIYGKLTANIELNSNVLKDGKLNEADVSEFIRWTPIGTTENPFIGVFDGDGKTISGLYFNSASKDSVGLFGRLGGSGIVKNVGLIDSYIKGKEKVGGIVAVNDGGSISNVFNFGVVEGSLTIGGIVGWNVSGSVHNAYSIGSANGMAYVGGLVGYHTYGTISNFYAFADVSGNEFIGGAVGVNERGSVSYGYYSTDMPCENCGGAMGVVNEVASVANVSGKTTVQLISLDVAEAFNGSDAWEIYNGVQPVIGDEKIVYKLPKLKIFENNPEVDAVYKISTAEQLKQFAERVNRGETRVFGKLTANIGLNGSKSSQWMPIGTSTNPFIGKFDGDGHTVSGLYIDDDAKDYVGLFGVVGVNGSEKGLVKNVGLVNSLVKGHDYVGGVVGYNEFGIVSDVFNMGLVSGNDYVGGVVGYSDGLVVDIYNSGDVEGAKNVGRVVGYNGFGTVNYGYYNTDMKCENCGDGSAQNIFGKTTAELASLDVAQAFPGSAVWTAFEGVQPTGDNKELVYWLPSFKNGGAMPRIKFMGYQPNADGVYEISTAQHLKWFSMLVNSVGGVYFNGKLMDDICLNACKEGDKPLLEQIASLGKEGDLSTLGFEEWTPIGTNEHPFRGDFDGNGHTIRGLFINDSTKNFVGLFGSSLTRIDKPIRDFGIVDSYIRGRDHVGSVIGSGFVKNVYNTGNVVGNVNVGGVAGSGSVENAYNTGTITAVEAVGGVIGSGYGTVLYNTGSVTASGNIYAGGIAGVCDGSISYAYNTGSVYALNFDENYIYQGNDIGGIVGRIAGSIDNVYNVGSVNGNRRVGGIAGSILGNMSNVYNTGTVKGRSVVGGLTGEALTGWIKYSYYNKDVSCSGCSGAMAEGTSQMQNVSPISTVDLAYANLAEIFPGSDAWFGCTEGQFVMKKGKLVYKLPGLSVFGVQPEMSVSYASKDYVYEISTAEQLNWFAQLVNKGNVEINGKLMRDIVVNEHVLTDENGVSKVDADGNYIGTAPKNKWTPIGTDKESYKGTFDGNGYAVSGLYVISESDDENGSGLFGNIGGVSVVRNVGVVDSYIKGNSLVGGVVGDNVGSVSNVYNTGYVVGTGSCTGGIVGYSFGEVDSVYNNGTVRGNSAVGGVVGQSNVRVGVAYNTGSVNGIDYVGGVVGYLSYGDVSDVYNMGPVHGRWSVGGVAGFCDYEVAVSNAYSSGTVKADGLNGVYDAGGVVGRTEKTVINNSFYNTDMDCENCNDAVGVVEGNASVTNVSGISTAQLASLDVASAFSNAEGIWKSGSVVNGENGTVIYKLPYLSKFEESNQPSITGSLEVSVANNDVYLKSDAVTNEDFKVSLVVNGHRSADKDGEFKFTKSTWGEDGVVKGTYDGFDFKVASPSVVISSDKKKAKVFGYSENTVEIAENVDVPKIDFTRKLYKGKFSTVMFPFTPNEAIKNSGFYRFKDVSKNAEGKWQVHLGKAKEVLANTPYIMVVGDNGDGKEYVESISLNEGGVFSATPLKEYAVSGCLEEHLPDCVESGWKFIGSYEYTKWTDDNERASEIGKTYAFAGANGLSQGMKIGQFAKVGTGAYLYPMRAYLQYTGGAKAARAVPGSARESAVFAELPENIDVVVDGESDSDEKTTFIGSFNTRTGEITPVKDSYFDVKGRNLGNKKPNVKGSFYRQ